MSLHSVLTRLAGGLRTLLGVSGSLTLDQMGDQAEEANRQVGLQMDQIDALFGQVNSLPDKGSAVLENAFVTTDLGGLTVFASWPMVMGGREINLTGSATEMEASVRKGGMLTMYAPGVKGASVTGGVEILEASDDGAVIAFEVNGPGTITLTA